MSIATLVLVLLLGADPAGGATDKIDWHVVQPGETLQGITESYLGTFRLWRENWKLNPDIQNPNRLSPGQRIRVIVERTLPPGGAEIEEVANEVDKNQARSGWLDATVGDRLAPRDGVRTGERSSTVLAFDDQSRLQLTEQSQVFLRDYGRNLLGVQEGEIEIERGQADLTLVAERPNATDIEIIVGDTVTRPKVGPSGTAETRTRRDDGGAAVMVYGGSSNVEAAGVTVPVRRGMGTTVDSGEPPKPPERLLRAPSLEAPDAGSEWGWTNPRLSWKAVPKAASYVVEICADTACTALLARAENIAETSWIANVPLPAAELHWRVTARSSSGLDGYPATTRAYTATTARHDANAPTVSVAIAGAGHVDSDGSLVVAPGSALRVWVRDDASGTAAVRARWNEGEWQNVSGDLAVPSAQSQLEVVSEDMLGRQSAPLTVTVRPSL